MTQKGRGYQPARRDPEKFHGAGPFEVATGEPLNNGNVHLPSYSTVFGETMVKIARKDDRVLSITAAMARARGWKIRQRFPDRFFDVGIAEQHAVNFAAGLAVAGLKPVVAIYSTFLQRAYDQIYHDVCLMDLPVVFALDRAGIVPDDGPTHQGINDIVYLRHMPHMIVMAPRDENELQHMLWSALTYGHPAAVRFPKGPGPGAARDGAFKTLPLGRAEVLKEGQDLLFAFGSTVPAALEAASELDASGISLGVVNARFAKPLDEELILRYAQPGRTVITVEEGVLAGGLGSAVRELLDREKRFDIRFKAVGIPLEVYPLGKTEEIRRALGLDAAGLAGQIRTFYASRT